MKQAYPTTFQANLMFLLISIMILIGSSLLLPLLGIGTNLWINEYIWILAPVTLLIKFGRMPSVEVLKLIKPTGKNIIIGVLSAISLWFFAFFLSKATGLLLSYKIGDLNTGNLRAPSSNQAILLVIGMLILAPICEELLFRGVIQSAYEARNKKYGFVMSAILFGMFHVLNGITEVIPAIFLGLMLGYLVYRTGSIITSMVAHMTINFCALFLNGSLGLSKLTTIPLWLTFVSITGIFVTLLLLSRLQPNLQLASDEGNTKIIKKSIGSVVLFILAILYVICFAVIEIYVRLEH